MAFGTTQDLLIEPLVSDLRKRLEATGIVVESIILFGSYVHGTSTNVSDIDLAIISSSFSGVRFHDVSRIIDLIDFPDSRLELHPYRPEDFTESNPFIQEILSSGKVMYDRRQDSRK